MQHPCFFCGGAAHPATGHAYSETAIACRRCTLEAFSYVQGWTNHSVGRRRRDGSERVRTEHSFYEAATLWQRRGEEEETVLALFRTDSV
jgi:hypothetical protein